MSTKVFRTSKTGGVYERSTKCGPSNPHLSTEVVEPTLRDRRRVRLLSSTKRKSSVGLVPECMCVEPCVYTRVSNKVRSPGTSVYRHSTSTFIRDHRFLRFLDSRRWYTPTVEEGRSSCLFLDGLGVTGSQKWGHRVLSEIFFTFCPSTTNKIRFGNLKKEIEVYVYKFHKFSDVLLFLDFR